MKSSLYSQLVQSIHEEEVIEVLKDQMPSFLENREKELIRLKDFISSANFEEIRKIAHQWQGYCDPYGFRGLGVLAVDLGAAARAEDDGGCREILKWIEMYLKEKKVALRL